MCGYLFEKKKLVKEYGEPKILVNEKDLISFAAQDCWGMQKAARREIDEIVQ